MPFTPFVTLRILAEISGQSYAFWVTHCDAPKTHDGWPFGTPLRLKGDTLHDHMQVRSAFFNSSFSTDEDQRVGDDGRSQFGEVEGKALAFP